MPPKSIIHVGMGGFNPQVKNYGILADTCRRQGPNRFTKLYPKAIVTEDILNYDDLRDKVYAFTVGLQEKNDNYEYVTSPENHSLHQKIAETVKTNDGINAPFFNKTVLIDKNFQLVPPKEITVIVFNKGNVTANNGRANVNNLGGSTMSIERVKKLACKTFASEYGNYLRTNRNKPKWSKFFHVHGKTTQAKVSNVEDLGDAVIERLPEASNQALNASELSNS